MKKILGLIIITFFLCSCGKSKLEEYVIIDVRTKEEFNESHLVNAINIPYNEIDDNLIIDKKVLIFVYCRSGNRSNIAKNTLQSLGYTVYDLGAYDNIDLPKE